MRSIVTISLTAALIGVTGLAQAAAAPPNPTLGWTYGELAYLRGDGNDVFETDAFQVLGSVALGNMWHAQASYTNGNADSDFGDGADFDGWQIGFGVHPQITPNTQIFSDLFYFNNDTNPDDGESADVSSDGFGLDVGLRHALTEQVELNGKVSYVEGNADSDTGEGSFDYHDTSVEAGIRYNWTPNFSTGFSVALDGSLGGGGSEFSSGDVARIDIRWVFGDAMSDSMDSSDSSDSY